jgi:hypothetical protein
VDAFWVISLHALNDPFGNYGGVLKIWREIIKILKTYSTTLKRYRRHLGKCQNKSGDQTCSFHSVSLVVFIGFVKTKICELKLPANGKKNMTDLAYCLASHYISETFIVDFFEALLFHQAESL